MVTSTPREPEYAQRMRDEVQQMMLRSQRMLEAVVTADDAKVGQTPKDIVWRQGRTRLYHYRRPSSPPSPTIASPLLMVHSLISKPYILDLYPGGSFIEFLLGQGFDVYMLDWGTPAPEDRGLRLENYAQDMIPRAVRTIAKTSPSGKVLMLGYCMGGLLASLYAALHPRAPLDALVCLTTPVDFTRMGLFGVWSDRKYFDVDGLVDRLGNVPAEFMRESFSMLKPASRYSPVQYLGLWQNILNDRYVEQYRAFNKWTNDHIPFPGECFRQTVKDLQWENKLIKGELELGGKRVDLGAIKKPFLHITAARDHIVPPESAAPLVQLVGSKDKEQIILDAGHVGIVAGRGAVKNLWPRVAGWLGERSSPLKEARTT